MQARTATPGDETSVGELLRASYPVLMAEDYDPEILATTLPRMVRANPALLASGTYYVVDGPGSAVIGCGGWTVAAPGGAGETAGLAHLRHFATHPDFTRRGIGRLIYDRCIEAAKRAGVAGFQAYSSLTAIPFYTSVGLRLVRHFDLAMGETARMPAALMEVRFQP